MPGPGLWVQGKSRPWSRFSSISSLYTSLPIFQTLMVISRISLLFKFVIVVATLYN
ncbi:unnamed protein product [Meloidogyne enterolobii]|uniref:Uncharacterized protein n=1 Tax=Meloidogyne enterolobii TaxID=390850 RepID=A0ACB0YK38_MELEN